MKYVLPLLLLLLINGACGKKKAKEQAQKDEEIIVKYINDHHLTAIASGSGLYYTLDNPGTGTQPSKTSQVKVSYKGYFIDGTVFDQSDTAGIIFGLQDVIKGWTEGLTYFKEGGNGKLLIPSALAYGPNGTQGIPGNSVLVFEVALIHVY